MRAGPGMVLAARTPSTLMRLLSVLRPGAPSDTWMEGEAALKQHFGNFAHTCHDLGRRARSGNTLSAGCRDARPHGRLRKPRNSSLKPPSAACSPMTYGHVHATPNLPASQRSPRALKALSQVPQPKPAGALMWRTFSSAPIPNLRVLLPRPCSEHWPF